MFMYQDIEQFYIGLQEPAPARCAFCGSASMYYGQDIRVIYEIWAIGTCEKCGRRTAEVWRAGVPMRKLGIYE